ncbi:leucine-rich repeat-containing protein 70-like, partial [Tropilaelaps mercedesae]
MRHSLLTAVDPLVLLWIVLLTSSGSIPTLGGITTLGGVGAMSLSLVDTSEMMAGSNEDKQPLTSTGLASHTVGVVATAEDQCPAGCLCKWSGGKQTAECGAAQLTQVPEGLNRDTQVSNWPNRLLSGRCRRKFSSLVVAKGCSRGTDARRYSFPSVVIRSHLSSVLNVSGNAISTLGAREFHRKGYASLQRIYASRCALVQVAPSAFHLLTNLVELDLSANQLQRVPSSALSDCGALRRLSLSYNPIEILHDDAFRGLSRLGTLELNHCRLTVIESLAFRGLRSLEFLRMGHNMLKRIPPISLIEHLPSQLYGVNLE